jgi:DNA (cytosine-5)-methyltransferase 1
VLGAADVGANHQRDRIWIVARNMAYSEKLFSNGRKNNAGIGMEREAKSELGNDCRQSNVAYSNLSQCEGGGLPGRIQQENSNISGYCGNAEVSDTTSKRQSGSGESIKWCDSTSNGKREANITESIGFSHQWSVEPDVGRVADGVAARVDRLKSIGNGQVPLCAATAWRILSEQL